MTLTCPVCNAGNTTPSTCRRCKADLSLLWEIESQRGKLFGRVRLCVAEQNYPEALATLDEVASLRNGADVDRLAAAIHLLAGDYVGALASRPRE